MLLRLDSAAPVPCAAGAVADSATTLAVVNRSAGGGRGAKLEPALRAALSGTQPGTRVVVSADAAAAIAAVATLPRGSRVVIVGGDGTLHGLLSALIAGDHAAALLPVGSGNDTARALGVLRLPWRDALQHALTAPVGVIDTGVVRTEHEQQPFVSSVCVGLDAAIARRARGRLRVLGSAPRYLLAALIELLRLRRHRLRVDADGRTIHDGDALLCAVLNTPSYGGGLPMQPRATVADGQLDAVVAGGVGRGAALALLLELLRARHLDDPRVRHTGFESLRVEAGAALPLAADGEPLVDARRIDIEVRAQSLRVVGLWH